MFHRAAFGVLSIVAFAIGAAIPQTLAARSGCYPDPCDECCPEESCCIYSWSVNAACSFCWGGFKCEGTAIGRCKNTQGQTVHEAWWGLDCGECAWPSCSEPGELYYCPLDGGGNGGANGGGNGGGNGGS